MKIKTSNYVRLTLMIMSFLLSNYCLGQQEDNYSKGLIAFDSKDFEQAVVLLKPYADSGKCLAQYAVGFSYSNSELAISNDSLAEHYLLLASEQKHTHSMGILATLYFKKSYSEKSYNIKALKWAELAAEYDNIQKGLTTRYVIRQYMNKEEIEEAEKLIKRKKTEFNKIKNCT